MELFQIYWDETQNLILEFKADHNSDGSLDLADISRLSLKYEIVRADMSGYNNLSESMSSLISIKNFEILDDLIKFSLDFRTLYNKEDFRINFLRLKIHFKSGEFIEYLLKDSYELAEIGSEPLSNGFFPIERLNDQTASLTSERIISQTQSDLESNVCTKTVIYQRNHARFPTHHNELIQLLKENNQRLESLEKSIEKLTAVLTQNLQGSNSIIQTDAMNTSNYDTKISLPPQSLKPPPSPISANKEAPIVPIRKKLSGPPSTLTNIRAPKLAFIGELKSVLQSCKKGGKEFDFRSILKPMSDDELKSITLDDEELYKREIEFFSRQMVKKEA
ncbi:MAG: hypothetical protein ACTSPW_14155 [Promethearchaeota archaeon]